MEAKQILLVEDELRIAEILRMGLSENAFEVEIAQDGEKGFEIFNKGNFDLVVLDINLPLMNGVELCKKIRQSHPDTPIIMLTALGALQDKIEGYEAGADDYIVKPFAFQELLMKIRVLLRRTGGLSVPTQAVLKAADLTMNLETKEITRDGVNINLTAKEFQLLEYLLRNKNRVLSRADIARDVWDIDFDTNTNIIDVFINYVRNKVDKPFEKKLIVTQIGMGYVLKD
jgi:DNA-binding response OmpR family regulator